MAHMESAHAHPILAHPEDALTPPRCMSPDTTPIMSYGELLLALEKLELQSGEVSDISGLLIAGATEATESEADNARSASPTTEADGDDNGGDQTNDPGSPAPMDDSPVPKDESMGNGIYEELVEFGGPDQSRSDCDYEELDL